MRQRCSRRSPVTHAEQAGRTAWRARYSRFALAEAKPKLDVRLAGTRTVVTDGSSTAELDDDELIEAVMGLAARTMTSFGCVIGPLSGQPAAPSQNHAARDAPDGTGHRSALPWPGRIVLVTGARVIGRSPAPSSRTARTRLLYGTTAWLDGLVLCITGLPGKRFGPASQPILATRPAGIPPTPRLLSTLLSALCGPGTHTRDPVHPDMSDVSGRRVVHGRKADIGTKIGAG